MRKGTFIVIFISTGFMFFALAQPRQTFQKRIQEEKRKSLKITERPTTSDQAPPSPKRPIKKAHFTQLLSQDIALFSDACKMVVILKGVERSHQTFELQLEFLKKEGIISPKIATQYNAHSPLRKGVAAYMFCKTLEIKGGLTLRLFGVTPRYALKELIFEGIMLPGHPSDIMSGKELVYIVTQAADYMARRQEIELQRLRSHDRKKVIEK